MLVDIGSKLVCALQSHRQHCFVRICSTIGVAQECLFTSVLP